MIRDLFTYLLARFRMIGRCPPHRYTDNEGRQFGFCLNCGEYPTKALTPEQLRSQIADYSHWPVR